MLIDVPLRGLSTSDQGREAHAVLGAEQSVQSPKCCPRALGIHTEPRPPGWAGPQSTRNPPARRLRDAVISVTGLFCLLWLNPLHNWGFYLSGSTQALISAGQEKSLGNFPTQTLAVFEGPLSVWFTQARCSPSPARHTSIF